MGCQPARAVPARVRRVPVPVPDHPRRRVRVQDAWPVALLVAVLLVLLQNLFALYVGNFAHYNAIYGSLGAVIAFMFFVYLAAELFLLGAELASEWPRVRPSSSATALRRTDRHSQRSSRPPCGDCGFTATSRRAATRRARG